MEFRTRTMRQRLASGLKRRWRYWSGARRRRDDGLLERSAEWLRGALGEYGDVWPAELVASAADVLVRLGLRPATYAPSHEPQRLPMNTDSLALDFQIAAEHFRLSQRVVGERSFARGEARLASAFSAREQSPPCSIGQFQLVALVVAYLNAAIARVEAAFCDPAAGTLDTIDTNDGRMVVVRSWLEQLPAGARVADVGCGSGRYLHGAGNQLSRLNLIGVDPSAAALQRLPASVERRQGGMLQLPVADGELDAVMAIESLEHSLLPKVAIRELCRAVRPGGRLLIVDKHRRAQALSECEPWERWFWPEEVSCWLAPCCRDVRCEPIAHGPGGTWTGLFLAWHAIVRR